MGKNEFENESSYLAFANCLQTCQTFYKTIEVEMSKQYKSSELPSHLLESSRSSLKVLPVVRVTLHASMSEVSRVSSVHADNHGCMLLSAIG